MAGGWLEDDVWSGENAVYTFRLPKDLVAELDLVAKEASAPGKKRKDRTWVVKTILTKGLLILREERTKREDPRKR